MIDELLSISHYAGFRKDLVQAGGGNTSMKLEDKLYIKSSGVKLADMKSNYGYSVVETKKIKSVLGAKVLPNDFDESKCIINSTLEGSKASIETFLHVFTRRMTLHTHPILVNILMQKENYKKIIMKLFPDSLLVQYKTPGISLALEMGKENQFKNIPKIIFLCNHGLIINANSVEEVIELNEMVIKKIERYLGFEENNYYNIYLLHQTISKIIPNKIIYPISDTNIKLALKKNNNVFWDWNICPDCTVYCGKRVLDIRNSEILKGINDFITAYGEPVITMFDDIAYIIADNMEKARDIEDVLSFSATVFYYNEMKLNSFLDDDEQNYLLNWDAEKYRKSIE